MLRALAPLLTLLALSGAAAQDWPAVIETSLERREGSPLDFSTLMPNGTIGAERHLIVANGRFAYSDAPDSPVPLMCASLAWSPASGDFPAPEHADRYARQMAMAGYNIARFHFVESSLMFERMADFDYDPQVLDRFHYLLAALKREGISWIMDGMTSARGGLGGHDDRWDGAGDLKEALLLGPEGLDHWQRLIADILGQVNPYTGLAPLADPALAMIVLVNEGGLQFDSIASEHHTGHVYSPAILAGFNAWLQARYGSSAALASAWGGLGWGESLEAGTITLPSNRYGASPRFADLGAYFLETELAGTAAMSALLRDMGFAGAISNYNNWPTLQAALSRRELDAVTMNIYFDWVSGYAPGTRIEQHSSLARGLDYLRIAAATRWLGKPFVLTEYDHLFWNQYRYEAGLVMPAFAAFQGWDAICRHGHGPIVLRYGEDLAHKRQMLPYAIALDPVARAGETLAALLFRRGDVRPASTTIAFPVDETAPFGDRIEAREPEALTALAGLVAIGLGPADGTSPVPVDRHATPLWPVLETLVRDGSIAQHLVDGAGRGTFSSTTGEIAVLPDAAMMTVVTERTIAAAFQTLSDPLVLGPATLTSSSGPALLALSALDSLPLDQSRQILVIMATDARNSGMRFADGAAREIRDFGTLPVRIRPATITLRLQGSGQWTLAPVGLDGTVHPVLASGQGALDVTLDNAPASGPTTYFIIERD